MSEAKVGGSRLVEAERPQASGAASPGRGGRMSRQRKMAAAMRLLRGEDLETVSRGLGVTAGSRPSTWWKLGVAGVAVDHSATVVICGVLASISAGMSSAIGSVCM